MISRQVDLKNKIVNELLSKKEELTVYELLDVIVQQFGDIIPFKEPDPNNMLDESEEDLYAHDTRMFSQYIGGIENGFAPLLDYYEFDEYIVKYLYKNKEVILGATFEEQHPAYNYLSCLTATVIIPIDSEKRGHLGTIESFSNIDVIDLGDKLEDYDLKYAEEYQGYFSDKLPKIKEKTKFVSEKMIFTEEDKYFLKEIIKEFDIPSSVVFKDGYLCVDCIVKLSSIYPDKITDIVYFVDYLSQIIDKFSNK